MTKIIQADRPMVVGDRVAEPDGTEWVVALPPCSQGGVAALTRPGDPRRWAGPPGDPYVGVLVIPTVVTLALTVPDRDWGEA